MPQIVKKTISLIKKVLLVFTVYFLLINLCLYFINKDRSTIKNVDVVKINRSRIYTMINDKKNQSTIEGKIALALSRPLFCISIGEACTDNPNDGEINFPKSIAGITANLISLPYYNPPASGVYWAYSSLQSAGFIPKTYAAEGLGFSSIRSFMNIWKVIRDVALTLLVLAIVAIGFMIMFRTKLNPQTVITVENALPRIIVTLILITFSFAIAGFLIDLMYVLIALVVSILSTAGNAAIPNSFNVGDLTASYLTAGPGQIIDRLLGSGLGVNSSVGFFNLVKIPYIVISTLIGPVLFGIIEFIVTLIVGILVTFPFTEKILEPLTGVAPNVEAGASFIATLSSEWTFLKSLAGMGKNILAISVAFVLAGLLVNLLLVLVIFISVVVIFFRIFSLIIAAYIKIIILIILSPIMLIFNVFPGESSFGFSSWLKNLFAELLTFPILIAIFMMGTIMIKMAEANGATTLFKPPFMVPLNSQSLSLILSFAILFMTPDLLKTFKQLIVPKPMPLPDAGVGVFFGGTKGAIESGMGEITKWGSLGYYFQPIGKILGGLGFNTGGPGTAKK